MPIKTKDMFTKFTYVKDVQHYPQLIVKDSCWDWILPHCRSGIVLDGGNVIQNDSVVLMTDIVFQQNPHLPTNVLTKALESRFGKPIVFLPVEPEDDLGHIDGVANFIDEKRVFINDYSVMEDIIMDHYQKTIMKMLEANGLEPILFPYAYHKCPENTDEEFYDKYSFADDNNPGVGYYINYLVTPKVILAPAFGFEEDEKARQMLVKYYPNHCIKQIQCFDLSMLGGLIRCVTWECDD
jgi:agmatine/peptidylarginine deiminase